MDCTVKVEEGSSAPGTCYYSISNRRRPGSVEGEERDKERWLECGLYQDRQTDRENVRVRVRMDMKAQYTYLILGA